MNGKLTISLGLKIRLLLIASILSAWYRVTHSSLSAFAEMLLVPPALYVSYILISVGYTFSSYTTYYKKRKWYIMYVTRGSWATLIAWEEVTSKKQAWTIPSLHQNFSWKSYFKMTEVISLLRKKTKSKIESIHSMMFCAKWTYVSATEVNAFLLFSCYYTPKPKWIMEPRCRSINSEMFSMGCLMAFKMSRLGMPFVNIKNKVELCPMSAVNWAYGFIHFML